MSEPTGKQDLQVGSPFSAEKLREAVDSWLASVPPDHVAASIEYRATDGTLRVVAAAKVGDHWRVDGALAWGLRTGRVDSASVRVVGSWS